jgi:erythromycin esterase-like protein
VAARDLFQANRIERFVGVNYLPSTELRSHYSICNMSDQFDFIVHVDHSTALKVDKVPVSAMKSL